MSVAGATLIVPTLSASAVAVFAREPAVTSAAVIVYVLPVAVQLVVAPTARLATVHDSVGSSGSVTTTFDSASVPVLLTAKL